MTGKPISFIARNDSDQRFRDKCNENFRAVSARQQINPDDLGDVVIDAGLLASKVDQIDFDNAIDALDARKLEPSNVLAGAGISVDAGASTVTISAACPFPINALFSHVSADNPSTIWPGTTWTGPLEDSLAEATRWQRTA